MQQPASRRYLLGMLALMLAFNSVDRLALGIVLQDVKVDLALTDTQLGFVTGIAFAMFYAVLGIPIARWADRGNRVKIISITAILSGAAVALCGAATTFAQFLAIRVMVAVGEAGFQPPAVSLIADHFDRAERPRAITRFTLGVPLALTFGYFAAGWCNRFYGWRTTFLVVGVPTVLLGALAGWTLREPRLTRLRGESASDAQLTAPVTAAQPALAAVAATLWRITAFRHLLLCYSVWCFFGSGILQWQPAFFIRSHGLDTGTLGTWFALIYGVGGLFGTYVSGELATRLAANNERLQLTAIAALFVLFAALTAGAYLVDRLPVAMTLLAVAATGGAMTNGPLTSVTQAVVAPNMRATAIAVVFFFGNLIGGGLGPLIVGAISDALHPTIGDEALRYALLACCPGYFWAAFHAWRAGRAVRIDEHSTVGAAEPMRVLAQQSPAERRASTIR